MPIVKLPDGTVAVVCTRGGATPSTCVHCGQRAGLLCDFETTPGRTCDAAICRSCATSGGHEVDYCKAHADAGRGVQPGLPGVVERVVAPAPKGLRLGAEHPSKCLCGSAMVLRNGSRGRFYGCRSYPRCRNTRPAGPDGRPYGTASRETS